MIDIPVHDMDGQQVGSLQIDEQRLGGRIRHSLLKQAYVRQHANHRQGSAHTRNRSDVSGSYRKLYKQKGTGNARRGTRTTNIMRGGGHTFAKRAHSWRLDMPRKMRQLANRNALLAKAVDGEIKLVDKLSFETPSTKQFTALIEKLHVNRTCLVALTDTSGNAARSIANLQHVSFTQIDRLNAFDLLSHRYLISEKDALAEWIGKSSGSAAPMEAS